jgi:hypothetical protein
MVSPDALLITLDQHPVRARTPRLDPAVSLQRLRYLFRRQLRAHRAPPRHRASPQPPRPVAPAARPGAPPARRLAAAPPVLTDAAPPEVTHRGQPLKLHAQWAICATLAKRALRRPYALLHQVCCPVRAFRGHRRKPPSSSEERREARFGGGPFLVRQMCLTQRSGRLPRCRTRSSPVVVASGCQPQGITSTRSGASQQQVAGGRSVPEHW